MTSYEKPIPRTFASLQVVADVVVSPRDNTGPWAFSMSGCSGVPHSSIASKPLAWKWTGSPTG